MLEPFSGKRLQMISMYSFSLEGGSRADREQDLDTYIYLSIYVSIYLSFYIYLYIYMYIYCTYIRIYTIHIYIYICMYRYTYIYKFIHLCMHIHVYRACEGILGLILHTNLAHPSHKIRFRKGTIQGPRFLIRGTLADREQDLRACEGAPWVPLHRADPRAARQQTLNPKP